MHVRSLLQSFALDNGGRVRSVEEVTRGLACDCVCPSCLGRVIARQGEVRQWHFAHESDTDCPHAAETGLHKAAKQLIVESQGLMLPEQWCILEARLPDGRCAEGKANRPATWVDLSMMQEEAAMGGVRPDVLATFGNQTLAIEIAVTHFVDEQKLQRLRQLSVATIEIDLTGQTGIEWSWETLREAVIDNVDRKQWLVALEHGELQREAHAVALRNALLLPIPKQGAVPRAAIRKRHMIGGRIVDLIVLPFGVAVWAPYDPAINELIKSVVYPLGGHWKPRFKNWLVPLEGKTLLEQELARLSDTPPAVIGS